MTSGEPRFARCLDAMLEDDYLIWYDVPVGSKRLQPDFVILHPCHGLRMREVKDWKLVSLKKINKDSATLHLQSGIVGSANPLTQAKQCLMQVCSRVQTDPQLVQTDGRFGGTLCLPFAYGIVLPRIMMEQRFKVLDELERDQVLLDQRMKNKDKIVTRGGIEVFQKLLWDMFDYTFGRPLTLPQIDRVHRHLFPRSCTLTPASYPCWMKPRQMLPRVRQIC